MLKAKNRNPLIISLAALCFSATIANSQESPTGLLMDRAQLGLNAGAVGNSARAPLNRETQNILIQRQLYTLTNVEDIFSNPYGLNTIKDIYFRLPPVHLRDLHVEVFGRDQDGNSDASRRYALEELDRAVEAGGFHPDVVAGIKSPANQYRFRVWQFDVQMDGSFLNSDTLNEFEFNRLITALRRDLPGHIASLALPNPLPVTAICTVTLGQYDFSREGFALNPAEARASCFSNLDTSDSAGRGGLEGDFVATIPSLPDFVPVPNANAETFRNRVGEYVDLILPAELSVTTTADERVRTSLVYRLQATGPFSVQDRNSLDILWQSEEDSLEAATPQQLSWVQTRGEVQAMGPLLANQVDVESIEDTIFLFKLAAGSALDDRDWFEAMRARRAVEMEQDRRIRQASRNDRIRGWTDTWPRFFPRELERGDLNVFRNEFEQWSRLRAASLPSSIIFSAWGIHGFPEAASPSIIGYQRTSSVMRPELESRDVSLGQRLALRLPSFVGDYRVEPPTDLLDQARFQEDRDMTPVTEVMMEIGSISVEGNAVIVETRPTEVRYIAYDGWDKSDDIELAVLALDVPARDFGTVDSALEPAPLNAGPIYWETIDLLRLRHAPDLVSDSELQAMLERRFNAEKDDPDTPLPHFFELVEEVPNDAESRDAFKKWQQSRFRFIEGPLTLRTRGAVIDTSFGGAFTDFRTHGDWKANTWFRGFHPSCQIDRPSADLMNEVEAAPPEDARRMLACAAILKGRELLMSPAHADGFQFAQRPRAHNPSFVFDLDRVPEVTQAMMDEHARLAILDGMDISVRITGARQLNAIDPIPAEIGETIAGAILNGEEIEANISALEKRVLTRPLTAFVSSVESVSTRYRDRPDEAISVPLAEVISYPVDTFIEALAAINEREAMENDETAMLPVPALPDENEVDLSSLDILGLSIGMPVDEAKEIVANHMTIGWTLLADRRSQMMGGGVVPGWSSGVMYVDEANREFISLYYEPDAVEFGLLGVMRWVFVQPQSVDRSRLGPALQQRYGNPFETMPMQEATATGFLWTWTGPSAQGNCGFVPARSQTDLWELDNPDAPFRPPFAIYDLTLPDLRTRPNVSTYLMSSDVQADWLCPRTLSVRTSSVRPSFGLPEDQSHAIVSVLYDEQRAINTLRAAEAARAIVGNAQQNSGTGSEFEVDF